MKEGVQNRLPQGMQLGHMGYFELKATETLQVQKKLLPLPQSPSVGAFAHNNSYHQKQGRENFYLFNICFLIVLRINCLPFEAQRAILHSLVQDVPPHFTCLSLNRSPMCGLCLSHVAGVPMHTYGIKLGFLLLIGLMLV